MPRKHNEVDRYTGPEAPETNEYLRSRVPDCYMGFPTYRVVWSPSVMDFSGGEWCDWDENIPAEERGRLIAGEVAGSLVPETVACRRVVEVRRVPKYSEFEPGWILERWMAPDYWGTPEWWNRRVVAGTQIPSLGPFPHQGRYMHIGGPYPHKPTGPFLARLVEYWEAMRDEVLSQHADAYVRKRVYEAEERDRTRSEKWNRDASAANMEAMRPLLSTFLEGGIARQQAAEHAGLGSHFGN